MYDQRMPVQVKEISVEGTTSGIATLSSCPPGTYSNSMMESCLPCPAGTYSNSARSTQVKKKNPFFFTFHLLITKNFPFEKKSAHHVV